MNRNKWISPSFFALLLVVTGLLFFTACGLTKKKEETSDHKASFTTIAGRGEPLRIVSGSENKVLEPIVEEYAAKSNKKVSLTYLGSLDIMKRLQAKMTDFDAVWPASSIWLQMGDKEHRLKHQATTSVSPVIFGIKKSLARELGFVGRKDVKMEEIIQAIRSGKLKFAMTSATQSNSGASAYLAFLTAFSKNPKEGLTMEDLENEQVKEKIKTLLGGVNRSSGSSNWLVDLFLMGDYNAMVNYEQLIIQTNQKLVGRGKDPLYAVYPVDGLSLSDSPLAYVPQGEGKEQEQKEQDFLKFQEYILGAEAQKKIEETGKRNSFSKISAENKGVFKAEWGIQADRILSPIRFPKSKVILEALQRYQVEFKKPAYTIYLLDFSGSMAGKGHDQMMQALEQVLDSHKAKANLLQGTEADRTVIIPFASQPGRPSSQDGNRLEDLLEGVKKVSIGGGTALYEAGLKALDMVKEEKQIDSYTPAIVLLTDGLANGMKNVKDLERAYRALGRDVPIFSIQFGNADREELDKIAELTHARVFDGRKDLVEAFRAVKGYN